MADDWDERPRTIEEVKAMLQNRKEAALNHERTLPHAFSQQVLLSSSLFPFNPFGHVICHSFARLIICFQLYFNWTHRCGEQAGTHRSVVRMNL